MANVFNMRKMKELEKAIQLASQSNDKELVAELLGEMKAETAKGVAKSEKLCKDIGALRQKLKKS